MPGRRPTANFDVGQLTRVEGEGSLTLRVADGKVIEAHLGIFEAPRYFEALVVGRTPDEVIDIVARICGICPVAYQMSAVHAFEALVGVQIDPQVRALRRLFYCGEWIESHALHVYLLHAPDFLGYPSAIELARDHRAVVERALTLKRTGNKLVAALGARRDSPADRSRRRLQSRHRDAPSCWPSGRRSTRHSPRRRRRSSSSPPSRRRTSLASRVSSRCATRASTR